MINVLQIIEDLKILKSKSLKYKFELTESSINQ